MSSTVVTPRIANAEKRHTKQFLTEFARRRDAPFDKGLRGRLGFARQLRAAFACLDRLAGKKSVWIARGSLDKAGKPLPEGYWWVFTGSSSAPPKIPRPPAKSSTDGGVPKKPIGPQKRSPSYARRKARREEERQSGFLVRRERALVLPMASELIAQAEKRVSKKARVMVSAASAVIQANLSAIDRVVSGVDTQMIDLHVREGFYIDALGSVWNSAAQTRGAVRFSHVTSVGDRSIPIFFVTVPIVAPAGGYTYDKKLLPANSIDPELVFPRLGSPLWLATRVLNGLTLSL